MKRSSGLLSVGAVFAVLMVFGMSGSAFAFHHPGGGCGPSSSHWRHGSYWGPGSHLGLGFTLAPRPSGYYQTVTETVLVSPERVEQFWVPPEYQTITDSAGNPQTVKVRDGYMASRVIPAQYATVTRQVWVPSGPSFGVGVGFRF